MASKRYSAGRIFLQVVPSFHNLQNDIQRAVGKANSGLERQQEEIGQKNAQAQERGARKVRAKSADQQLREQERLQAAQLAQFQRFTQMMVSERAKESKRQADQDRRNAKSYLDLQAQVARGDIKQRADAERELNKQRAKIASDWEKMQAASRERDGRNAKNWFNLQNTLAQGQIKERAKAARDAAAAEEAEQRRSESRQDAIRKRRIASRLADFRRVEAERRRLAGGASGSLINRAAQGAADSIGVMRIDADSSEAKRKIAALREQLLGLAKSRIGVDLSAGDAMARIKLIQKELFKLSHNDAEIDVNVNAATALISLKRVEEQIDQINRKKATSGFLGMFGGMSGGADEGANSFRIFNWRVLGLISILPALAPMLASAAGAIGALATAAIGGAAGLGVMVLGFTGLQDAISAMGDVADNKAKDTLATSKAIRTAARGVRDAEQGLTQARQSGARAAEDSARRVTDARKRVSDVERDVARSIRDALRAQSEAEQRLADAQRQATQAQLDLIDARKQAERDQQDLADRIKSGQLDERQALIDLFNAQVAYNAAMSDGASTSLEREQAAIQLERARLAIKGIRQENADLVAEQKKGLAGNKDLAAATERVASTQKDVKDAQQGVIDAEERTRDARIKGAQDIADAQRAVSDALRDQRQQAADSARAIRDAQERVADAQAAQQEALTKTGEIGSASMQKLEQALGRLGPAGQKFAAFIFSLRDGFYDLRAIAQEGMLPPLQKMLTDLISKYGPSFKSFIATMGVTVGKFFTALGTALQSPVMATFFETMAKYAPIFFTQFGDIFINIMKIFAGLATAFAPFAKDFMDALVGMSDKWAEWAQNLAGSDGFKSFIDYVKKEGPKVWGLVQDIVTLILNIGKGMSETPIFDAITGLFHALASIDPGVAATLFTIFTGLAFASQIAAGINALVISIGFLMASAIGPWVVGLIAVGIALVALYNNNETFRNFINAAWTAIQGYVATFLDWMQTTFIPWWTGTAMPMILTVFSAIGDAAVWLWQNILSPTFRVFAELVGYVFRIVVALWTNFLWPAFFQPLMKATFWLWQNVFAPAFGGIAQIVKDGVNVLVWVWDHILSPMFDAIATALEGDLVGAFSKAVEAIKGIWDGMKRIAAVPVNFVIDTVLNKGLFAGINKVLEFLGLSSRIPNIPLVSWGQDTPSVGALAFKGSAAKNKYGFADGGYTGHGSKWQPAGIVHAGEVVFSQEDVKRWGGPQVVDAMRRGVAPGYAIGGMVKPVNARPGFPWGFYPSGRRHRALDLPVPIGTPVVSPYAGKVIRDGWDTTGFGTSVRLAADNGTFWIFGHLLREIVSVGQRLAAGARLGDSGNSGNSTGPHLHLEGRMSPYDPSSAFDFTAAFNGGTSVTPAAGQHVNLPWWADKPLEFLRGLANTAAGQITMKGVFGDMLRGVPNAVFDGARSFLGGIIGSGPGQDDASGGKYLWAGREVPDNGTQMFDNGGLLQPGVTQVLNMTGRPEPVFTADQFGRGGGSAAAALVGTYAPTFNESDITAADVMDEFVHTLHRVSHGGKFAGRHG